MDAQYAKALTAFISHRPREAPINPGAPDPLLDRPTDRGTDAKPMLAKSGGSQQTDGFDLLPLIYAQLPLAPSYRMQRRPSTPSPQRVAMTGR